MPEESLAIQLARFDEQLKGLRQIVEAARYVADLANRNSEKLAVHDERFIEMRSDIAEFKGELKEAVNDIRKSCNGLGDIIRAQEKALSAVQNDQDQVKEQAENAWTRREKWLLLLAGAFASGVVTLAVSFLTR